MRGINVLVEEAPERAPSLLMPAEDTQRRRLCVTRQRALIRQ